MGAEQDKKIVWPLSIALPNTTKPQNSHYSVPGLKFILCEKLHHSAFRHCRSSWSWFRDVYDTALGSQEHTCY